MEEEFQELPVDGWGKHAVAKAILNRLPEVELPEGEAFATLVEGLLARDDDAILRLYYGFLRPVVKRVVYLSRGWKPEISFQLECASGCLLQALLAYEPTRDGAMDRFIPLQMAKCFVDAQAAWRQMLPPESFQQQMEMSAVEASLHAPALDLSLVERYYQHLGTTREGILTALTTLKQRCESLPDFDRVPDDSEDTTNPVDEHMLERFVDANKIDSFDFGEEVPDPTEALGSHQPVSENLLADCEDETEHLTRKRLSLAVRRAVATLTPREEKVLSMRFGLNGGQEHTLEQVGLDFEVNRERIRQIESKALRKLRHPSRSRRLRGFVDDVYEPIQHAEPEQRSRWLRVDQEFFVTVAEARALGACWKHRDGYWDRQLRLPDRLLREMHKWGLAQREDVNFILSKRGMSYTRVVVIVEDWLMGGRWRPLPRAQWYERKAGKDWTTEVLRQLRLKGISTPEDEDLFV